ncbi:RluA family pseudouridine synthase [Erysipelothrix sp. HDW6C]|uniref:RluA family pseudouridine synthase n=1 Tax=Erysipelothrix sp. HDW6C TaxID=2714930 RepID=UPI00140DACE3|nr:RluA family pseudouridine synthase [Erysipelothrix sp. HDW6C]QIK69664.1 RluA family pseudouridine synthase [Erysipelothrix sp. HDW6C]
MKHTITVQKDDEVLNVVLNADLPYSRSKIKSLLKHECISIDNEVTTQFDDQVHAGQTITIVSHNQQRDTPLTIIYEDRDILVIDKPYKLLTVATNKNEELTAYRLASDYIKTQDSKKRIFIVHRLDQDTSGVLMFAKSEAVKKAYQDDWNNLVLDRTYVAIVEGKVVKDEDTIRSFLRENKTTHMYSTTTGQEAITHYKVIKKTENLSVLKVNLDTGRKNQIRVHMNDIGHPIIGDRKYDAKTNPIKRMGLHAYRLTIKNPKTHKVMDFVSPLPPKFKRLTKVTQKQEEDI